MTKDDIIRIAHEAGLHIATDVHWMPIIGFKYIEKFAALVAAAEREKVAEWMMQHSYATGHGDTMEDLLAELDWQIVENLNRGIDKGAADELRRLHELNEDLYQQGVGFIARIDALEQALGVVVKALEEIVEWTERYTTPGHPISTIGRAALVKAQGDNNANG